ncbi:GNAT family N-acetyltransferase [Shewanella sp. 10N.286.51.B2]|uniref:GNAT family N-acetyltransferase n=1 Tax=unclassified Shewanella TaxID=196818 RepID=UPI0026E20B78|nr:MULTISPECIES: GNAT family N-acetyltransferase [unclassified Shewanella]MDO6620931.1 GNAT family N-acetyltransferase [Shewanella sp. 6_MG-2023]MDO6639593.1 GNAT family N-acetyltransferase [Shewanella sp. 5_MG-2023]MDO6678056.1 GNAT family N-acetyltransferase [Shewanella sp. 4_MG-2023]
MQLVKPSGYYQQSYIDYITELGDEERYPFPLDFDHSDFGAMLEKISDFARGQNLPAGYVASETYWLVEGDELLGVANLRLTLNDNIRYCGGHIGLGIRPRFRGKGLGVELLAQTIALAKGKGINELHIHCYKHNLASAKMIIANGGVLDSEIELDTQSNEKNQQDNAAAIIQRYRVS